MASRASTIRSSNYISYEDIAPIGRLHNMLEEKKLEREPKKKYHFEYNITTVNGVKITRGYVYVPVSKVQSMVKNNCIIVDKDINREEVKKRNGTADEYSDSADNNMSLGQFAGYTTLSDDKVIIHMENGDFESLFTPEHPLLITEGGHRTRWLMSLQTITSDNRISFTFVCGSSADTDTLRKLVGKEFWRLNLNVCVTVAGEMLRSDTPEETRKRCIDALTTLIESYFPKTPNKRANRTSICDAIVNCVVKNDFTKLHTKLSIVNDRATISVDDSAKDRLVAIVEKLKTVCDYLREKVPVDIPTPQSLLDADAAVKNARGDAKKAAKDVLRDEKEKFKASKNEHKQMRTKVEGMVFQLDLIGPFLYGIMKEENTCVDVLKRWVDACVRTTESWNRCMSLVTDPTTAARSYTEERYAVGWTAIKQYSI